MRLLRAEFIKTGDVIACGTQDHKPESPTDFGVGPIVFRTVREVFQHKSHIEITMDYIDLPATTDSISLRETTILLVAEPQDLEKA